METKVQELLDLHDEMKIRSMNKPHFRVVSGGVDSIYFPIIKWYVDGKDKEGKDKISRHYPVEWNDQKDGDMIDAYRYDPRDKKIDKKKRRKIFIGRYLISATTDKCLLTGKKTNLIILDLDSVQHKNCQGVILWNKEIKKHGDVKTLMCETPSGGLHVYFQYDDKFKDSYTKLGSKYEINEDGKEVQVLDGGIDLLSDGKNCTAGGTFNPFKNKHYKYINDYEVKKMPKWVEEWLEKLISVHEKHIGKKQKNKNKRIKETDNKNNADNNDIPDNIKYKISEKKLISILKELDNINFIDFMQWFYMSSAVKSCTNDKKYEIWDKYCSSKAPNKYDKHENKRIWDSLQPRLSINYLINKINKQREKNKEEKMKFVSPTREFELITESVGKEVKKSIDELSEDNFKLELYDTHIICSGTGTAKTNSTMEAFKELQENIYKKEGKILNFMSIVSRISLCKAQIESWNRAFNLDDEKRKISDIEHAKEINNCEKLYSYEGEDNYNKQNIVTTINSLYKHGLFKKKDFKNELQNYVIFLDEFHSLLGYLFDDANMGIKNTRTKNLRFLLQVIKYAGYVICCDAHISDMELQFLKKQRGEDSIRFINNTKQCKKDIKVNNYHDEKDFIDKIKKIMDKNKEVDAKDRQYFCMTFDSLTYQKRVHKLLGINCDNDSDSDSDDDEEEDEIPCITINSVEKPEFYKTKNISDIAEDSILSYTPSIVYGNSIITDYPMTIFTFVTGRTLDPLQIVQQISRCRVIKEININSINVIDRKLEYLCIDDIKKHYEETFKNECTIFKDMCSVMMDDDGEIKILDNIYSKTFFLHKFYKDALFSNFKYYLKKFLLQDGCIWNDIKGKKNEIKEGVVDDIKLDKKLIEMVNDKVKIDDISYCKQILNKDEPDSKKEHATKKRKFIDEILNIPLKDLKKNEEMMKCILYGDEYKYHINFYIYSKPIAELKKRKNEKASKELSFLLTGDIYTKIYVIKKFESLLEIPCFGELSDDFDLSEKFEINDKLWKIYTNAYGKKSKREKIKPKTYDELHEILWLMYKRVFGMTQYSSSNKSLPIEKRMIVRDYEKKQKRVNGKIKSKTITSEPYFDREFLELHLNIYQYRNPNNQNMNEDFKDYFNIKEIKTKITAKDIII